MAQIAEMYVEIGAKIDGLTSALNSVQTQLMATKGKVAETHSGFGSLWKQFAVGQIAADVLRKGFRFLTDSVKDSVNGALEAEKSESRLKIALDSTGRSTKQILPGLLTYSKTLMKQTTYTDEAAQEAMTLLAQLTKLDSQGIKAATKGAMGLATVMGTDLRSATMLVVKAMEGNTTALKRAGIEIDKSLKGDAAKAEILKRLAVLYQQTTGEADTFGGRMKQLGNMVDETKEAIGGAIVKNQAFKDLIEKVTGAISNLISSGKLDEWVTAISRALTFAIENLGYFTNALKGLATGGVTGGLNAVVDHLTGIDKVTANLSSKGRRAVLEFRASLASLTPTTKELQREIERGEASWEKYKTAMKAADDEITAGKNSIVGWISQGAGMLGLVSKMPPALNETGTATAEVTKAAKSLKDELGLIFTSDLKTRINQIETALIAYKGKLAPESEKKLRDELALLKGEFKVTASTVEQSVPPLRDMSGMMEGAALAAMTAKEKISLLSKNLMVSEASVQAMAYELTRLQLALLGIVIPDMRIPSEPFKESVDNITELWGMLCLKILTDIGDTWADVIAGTKDAADAMLETIQGVVMGIGSMFGPLGSVIAGVLVAITDVVRALTGTAVRSAEEIARAIADATDRMADSLANLGDVSDSTARSILDDARAIYDEWQALGLIGQSLIDTIIEIGKAGADGFDRYGRAAADAVAMSQNLNDLIRETGINAYNFTDYMELASEALRQYSMGLLSARDASGILDDAFSALQQAAQELGLEGSDAMVDFILQAREAGLEIASVTEYVQETLSKIPDALATMADNIPALADKLAVLTDKLAEQEAALAKLKPGSQEYLNMLAAIAETKAGIDAVTAAYQGNADTIAKAKNAGVLALTTFNSMIASGMSWGDALAALAPTLATLKARYEDLGLAADPALQQLMNIAKVREEHKALFDNIDANLQVMQALANTGYLTAEALAAIESNAKQYYKNLIKAGMSADDATRAMAPTLQAIYDAHKKSGEPIDKNTQKLIDQAKALGLIKEETPDPGTVMAQGMNRLVVILEAIAKALGATIPAAAEDGADAISQAMGNAADDVTKDMGTAATDVKKALGAAAIDTGKAWGTALTGITDGPMKDLIGGAGDAQKEWEGAAKGAIKAWGGVKIPGTTGLTGGNVGGAGIKAYAEGGVAWTPQLATVAEREPEIIMPLSDYQSGTGLAAGVGSGASAGAGRGVTINYAPVIQAMDSQDVHRFMAGKGRDAIVGILRSNLRGLAREFAVETSKYGGR